MFARWSGGRVLVQPHDVRPRLPRPPFAGAWLGRGPAANVPNAGGRPNSSDNLIGQACPRSMLNVQQH
eukprot:10621477-Alexandrium_andersonii.AAC.1